MNFDKHSYAKFSFFKKYILSVYPDNKNPNYEYNNDIIIYLDTFRKNNFPIIDEVVNNNSFKFYKTNLKNLNKLGNFIFSSNYSNSNFNIFFKKCAENSKKSSVLSNTYSFIFFLENHFYYFLTYRHFSNPSNRIFVKFDYIFLQFLKSDSTKSFVNAYDLDNIFDWFNFNKNITKSSTKLFSENINFSEISHERNFFTRESVFTKYAVFMRFFLKTKKVSLNYGKIFLNDIVIGLEKTYTTLINLNKNLSQNFKINFSETSTNKYINISNNFNKRSNFIFFFLRKNKIFNKGRYSRNRQTYRTGFYWCLWVNIFAIYGLHYLCYRFTFAFGYLWIPFIVFFGSFIFSRMLKYNFHNYYYVITELKNFCTWGSFILNNFLLYIYDSINFLINFLKSLSNFSYFKNCLIFLNHTLSMLKALSIYYKNGLNSLEYAYVWHYLSNEDLSFLKISSKKFFLTQLFLPLSR